MKLIQITDHDIVNAKNICALRSAVARDLNVSIDHVRVTSLVQIQIAGHYYALEKKIHDWLIQMDYHILQDNDLIEKMKPIRFGLKI